MTDSVFNSHLKSLPLFSRGKVRDTYLLGDDQLLMVASDRLSAFDVVLQQAIPGKGQVLTQMSLFWFKKMAQELKVAHHLLPIDPETKVLPEEISSIYQRAMVVKRLQPISFEAVVRGYLAGSAWQAYQTEGQVCGVVLPKHLRYAEKLPKPIFTPAYKARAGAHDQNITFSEIAATLGLDLAKKIRELSLAIYQEASAYALSCGIIIADTKFEFGLDQQQRLVLMDELLTPDSSRFWLLDKYQIGLAPPSLDKQFVRDYLEKQTWDKKLPVPILPAEVIEKTAQKYQSALQQLTYQGSGITRDQKEFDPRI